MSKTIRVTINLNVGENKEELAQYDVKVKDLVLPRLSEGIQLAKGPAIYFLHVVDVVHVKRTSIDGETLEEHEVFINTVRAP